MINSLDDEQLLRYARHIVLDEVGLEGQQKLLASSALIIGIGALGGTASLYLGASGLGRLLLVDFDQVERSNLARQISHYSTDIGRDKVDSAKEKILALNGDICIQTYKKVSAQMLLDLAKSVDIVLDGTDNFSSRFLINRVCIQAKKPLISAAVIGFSGQLAVFKGYENDKPCYRCLYDERGVNEDSCVNNGVLSPVAGMLATMQATQAIKVLLNIDDLLDQALLLIDAKTMQSKKIKLKKDNHCPVCQKNH